MHFSMFFTIMVRIAVARLACACCGRPEQNLSGHNFQRSLPTPVDVDPGPRRWPNLRVSAEFAESRLNPVKILARLLLAFSSQGAFNIVGQRARSIPSFLGSPFSCRGCALCSAMPCFVDEEKIAEISEPAFVHAAASMASVSLTLPDTVASGPVEVTYLRTNVKSSDRPPLLLLHGFDISCLEYRRLLPLLEEAGLEAYAPCILGWGFTDTSNALSVGIEAKREQLLAFWQNVLGGRPAAVVGASLGACMATDLFAAKPDAVASLIFLDPGIYTPAPPAVPRFVASLLINNVLGAPSVRESIAKQAYFDKPAQTEDAIRVGMLHVARDRWAADSTEWLLSGGYNVSGLVPSLSAVPSLTLWGREDEVIPPDEPLPLLLHALPSTIFRWISDSGHTPHLEQPKVVARAIAAFLQDEAVPGDGNAEELVAAAARWAAAKKAAVSAGEWAVQTAKTAGSKAGELFEKTLARNS